MSTYGTKASDVDGAVARYLELLSCTRVGNREIAGGKGEGTEGYRATRHAGGNASQTDSARVDQNVVAAADVNGDTIKGNRSLKLDRVIRFAECNRTGVEIDASDREGLEIEPGKTATTNQLRDALG